MCYLRWSWLYANLSLGYQSWMWKFRHMWEVDTIPFPQDRREGPSKTRQEWWFRWQANVCTNRYLIFQKHSWLAYFFFQIFLLVFVLNPFCYLNFIRSVENIIDGHKALPTTFKTFLHLILMQEGRMLTLLKVWTSFYRYGKFLSWDQLQWFYLLWKRVCPKKQHTMGCLVKLMPHWYVTRASISITFDFSDPNWFFWFSHSNNF